MFKILLKIHMPVDSSVLWKGYEKWWHRLHCLEQSISAHGLPFWLLLVSCLVHNTCRTAEAVQIHIAWAREWAGVCSEFTGIHFTEKPQLWYSGGLLESFAYKGFACEWQHNSIWDSRIVAPKWRGRERQTSAAQCTQSWWTREPRWKKKTENNKGKSCM